MTARPASGIRFRPAVSGGRPQGQSAARAASHGLAPGRARWTPVRPLIHAGGQVPDPARSGNRLRDQHRGPYREGPCRSDQGTPVIDYVNGLLVRLLTTRIPGLLASQISFNPPDKDWRGLVPGMTDYALNIYLVLLPENVNLRSNASHTLWGAN